VRAPRPGTADRWGPPPRLLVVTGAVVLAVATVLAILGATRAGITTDEPIHVMRLRNYFDTGWYALDWDYGGAGPGGDGTNTYVYAPVTMLLLHGWCWLWGVEGWHTVSTSEHAYHVRHLGVVVIGLLGVAAVAATGRVVLRYWRWGLVAAAALSAVPMWTGHAMFNVKDTPVATGHTLATLGLLLCIRTTTPRLAVGLARAGCLTAGLVLTLGTRPGMWSGLLILLLVAVVGVLYLPATRRLRATTLAEIVASCLVAAGVLVATYLNLFGSPLRALPRTSEASSSFLGGEKTDRWYVPRHLIEELPLLLLLFAITGVVAVAVLLLRDRRDERVLSTRLSLVGVQALALPVAAIVLGSDLYHGLRQLLFAIPALAVLATYGIAWWLQRPRPEAWLVASAASVALVLPTIDQVTLQPYQTTYVNLATDLLVGRDKPADSRPGGDYWRVSIPELVRDAPLDLQLVCKATTAEPADVAYPFTNGGEAFSTSRSTDCREEANGPLAPAALPTVRQLPVTQYDAVFIGPLPTNCTPVDDVTRWRHGFEVVLSTLGRCTVTPSPLTETGVRADDPVIGTTQPGDLWLYATDGWLQWPGRPELTAPVPIAGLAFRPDASCGGAGCTLVIASSSPADVVASVDGTDVPVSRAADGSLELPISAEQAGQDVWVSLSRRSTGPLDVRLFGLSLVLPTGSKGTA